MAPPTLMSPRVPGVSILAPNATGPQYARWRRGVKAVFTGKGTWGHCDGSAPMPMPESGPSYFAPSVASSNPQPGLLEERKAWVKKDREVKLDLFLSVADEIKLEIFEVGPPLPPSSMTALEMMEALDAHFHTFNFEEYHHVFCHFLNLHIDQYANLEDFNTEFQATLDDLLDHGAPMTNTQACSAYFSKLRCTQNPWVARKLKDWNSSQETPLLKNLMKECPPWIVIRPLATRSNTQQSGNDSLPEEDSHDHGSSSDNEGLSDSSDVSTISSQSSHSRQTSDASTRSQEITIHASFEDLSELADAFPMPQAGSPKHLTHKASLTKMTPLPPINRPLPPLPPPSAASSIRSRSASPNGPPRRPPRPDALLTVPPSPPNSRPHSPALRSTTPSPPPRSPNSPLAAMEQLHPALRNNSPSPPPSHSHISSQIRGRSPPLHPTVPSNNPRLVARASAPPTPPLPSTAFSPPARASTPSPPLPQFTFSASSDLAPPNLDQRPTSSRSMVAPSHNLSSYQPNKPLLPIESSNSSMISLPLQGTTTPEYHDTLITENGSVPSKLSSSPPRTIINIARLTAESEDDKRSRKRSWSVKARDLAQVATARLPSRRYEVKEMI